MDGPVPAGVPEAGGIWLLSPPPTLRERGHGCLARRLVAVRRRAILMVAEGERNFLASEHGFRRVIFPRIGWHGTYVANDTYAVFVSYSRADGRHAAEIDSVLRDKGLNTFLTAVIYWRACLGFASWKRPSAQPGP
jgi:hypothetical protein